jgi:polysaccharide biosynthesis/export protein
MKTGLLKVRNSSVYFLALASLFLLGSCTAKKITYFQNINEGVITSAAANLEPVIQKSDILSITVTSPNPEATVMFNAPNTAYASNVGQSAGNIAPAYGYLVNQDGYVEFPSLGKVLAAGLTKQALKEEITKALLDKKLLVDPIVTVRYLNYRVTVIGEVNRPSVVPVPNEKITILEAIGLAGDLTIYGKRENVLLIREEKGSKIVKRINLNSPEIISSPYYYLKSNDVVYVEPNNTKVYTAGRTSQILPIVLSSLSLIAVIITRVF